MPRHRRRRRRQRRRSRPPAPGRCRKGRSWQRCRQWRKKEVGPTPCAPPTTPATPPQWPEEERATPVPLATSTPWDADRAEAVDKPFVPAARDPIELASLAASLAALSPLGGAGSWKGEKKEEVKGEEEEKEEEEEVKEEPLANLTSPPVLSPPLMETPVSTRAAAK